MRHAHAFTETRKIPFAVYQSAVDREGSSGEEQEGEEEEEEEDE